MNIKSIVIFATGVAAGCAATFFALKNKYEQMANDEIQSYKDECKKKSEAEVKCSVQENSEMEEEWDEEEKKQEMNKYEAVLNRTNYSSYMTQKPEEQKPKHDPTDDPYIIDYEEYGSFADYDTMTLTYFADKVLVDDVDDVIEDVDIIAGLENLKIFDEEPLCRSIYVRNEVYKTDYEILKDDWNYSDIGDVPAKVEDIPDKKPHQL